MKKKRAAFSLIEAAIVLGIVGLVVAGIWIAAGQVMRNHRVSKLVEDVTLIMNRLMPFKQQMVGMGPSQSQTFLINSGVLPADWIQNNSIKFMGNYVTPYLNAPGGGADMVLVFYFTDLKFCTAVANYFAGRLPQTGGVSTSTSWTVYRLGTVDSDSNFIWVYYGQNDRNGTLPNCDGADSLEIDFSFY